MPDEDRSAPLERKVLDRAALAGLLADERRQLAAQVADLTSDLEGIVEVAAAAPPDDEHDPEGSTVGFERAKVTSLLAGANARLADLDRAEERLRAGTFGTCRSCGRPIPVERLRAQPAAETCIGCAAAPAPSRLRRH